MTNRIGTFLHHHGLFVVLALAFVSGALFLTGDNLALRATMMNFGYVFAALTVFGLGLRWVFRLVGIDVARIFDKGDNNATGAAVLAAGFVLGVAHVVGSVLH